MLGYMKRHESYVREMLEKDLDLEASENLIGRGQVLSLSDGPLSG